MRAFLAALLITGLVAWASPASAYTCNGTGCTWSTGYTEPSTLTNGQALTDLTGCTATYTVSVDGAAAGAAKTFPIPASKPSGGGVIAQNTTDATMLPNHTYAISETLTCASTAFGTSAPTAPATKVLNNGVAPNTGTGLTIQ